MQCAGASLDFIILWEKVITQGRSGPPEKNQTPFIGSFSSTSYKFGNCKCLQNEWNTICFWICPSNNMLRDNLVVRQILSSMKTISYHVRWLSVISRSRWLFICFRDFFWNAFIYFIVLIIACIAGCSGYKYHFGTHFLAGLFRIKNL